jgi:ATP-binding cassette, subfamily B, bacterial
MISKHYGKHYNADTLRQQIGFNKRGVSMLGISETAERIGFRCRGAKLKLKKLHQMAKPGILHWDQNHFVVLISVSRRKVVIADPSRGIITYTEKEFKSHWFSAKDSDGEDCGLVLILEPSPRFYELEGEKEHKLS